VLGSFYLRLVLGGCLLGLGYDAVQPSVPPQNADLASWLAVHHFRAGLAPYSMAASVSLDSRGSITMAVVGSDGGILIPCHFRYHGYAVQVWDRNLLPMLHHWAPMVAGAGCTP
jgi:hypothetical protein